MPREGRSRRRSAWRRIIPLAAAAAALLPAIAASPAAQAGPAPVSLAALKRLPGVTIARATARIPETPMKISGYRVERLSLPAPVAVAIGRSRREVQEAWRVTVSFAAPLTVRDQAFSLVIDGRWCGFLAEAADLRSADALCFEPGLIRDGATIGVTYRGITIEPREDAGLVGPDAQMDPAGEEPIHSSSTPLRLQGGSR